MKSESRLEHDPSSSEFPFIEESSNTQDDKVTPARSRLIYNSNGEYIDLTGNLVGDGVFLNQTASNSSPGKMFGVGAYRTNQVAAPNGGSSPLPPCANNNRFQSLSSMTQSATANLSLHNRESLG